MKIELKKHNIETYKNIVKLFEVYNRVAVEQFTGSGKSYISAKLVEDNIGKKIYFLSPSTNINSQFLKLLDEQGLSVNSMTYQKLSYISKQDIEDIKPDILILDEYHRLGAKSWGNNVSKLLKSNPNVKVLGLTATPVRNKDNKNMTEILFNNVVANRTTLINAIEEGIIKKPKYINGFYSVDEDIKILGEKIKLSKNTIEEKKVLYNRIKKISDNFHKARGIENVLKKYITDERKIIVFCANINTMKKMNAMLKNCIKNIFNEDVAIYEVGSHITPKMNKDIIKSFENANENKFNLLFTVDMLNEGLHIKGLTCAIFLRSTRSSNIYYQQMGRVLTTGSKKNPLIFDFVNNSKNMLINNPKKVGKNWGNNAEKREKTIELLFEHFDFVDESKDIVDLMKDIEENLIGIWDKNFIKLKNAYIENGNYMFLEKKEYKELSSWAYKEKNKMNERCLRKRQLFKQINFPSNRNDYVWNFRFNQLKDYINQFGALGVVLKNTKDEQFDEWILTQRHLKKKGTLSVEREEKLNSIGFIWNYLDEKWESMHQELVDFKEKHGHTRVFKNREEYKKLYNWYTTQRKRKDKLSEYRYNKLLDLGVEFNKITSKIKH